MVLYELLFEKLPFADEQNDPMAIYEVILTSKLRYPRRQQQLTEAKSVISQLLNKNPSLRMASGFEKLKNHPWFTSIDWEKLLSKQIEAPYIPKVKKINLDKALEKSMKSSLESRISKEEDGNFPVSESKTPLGWDDDF